MGVFPFPPIIPAFIFGPLLLVFEYILAKRGGTGIAHDAHLAGALFGVIFITYWESPLEILILLKGQSSTFAFFSYVVALT